MNPKHLKYVDPMIRDLVEQLNAAGFATDSSCQGRTSEDDFEQCRHWVHSFVLFLDSRVLGSRKARAKKLGLFIYNDGASITALSGRERDVSQIFARNLAFPSKMRRLFDLPPASDDSE